MNSDIYRSDPLVSRSDRKGVTGKGAVVWFTGLSGSGKSTIARLAEKKLCDANIAAYRLDGDNIRLGINSDLGFSEKDREENIRRVSEIAALFEDAGLVCLVSCISPFEGSRRAAKEKAKRFITVFVKASVKACAERDVKGLYKRALNGEIPNFTGVSSPYEEPLNADLVLDTEASTPEECAEIVIDEITKILGA